MSKDKSHLKPFLTGRGFKHLPELPGTGPQDSIKLYESSNARGPHVWVHVATPAGDATIELDRATLEKLIQQARFLRFNHYQGR